MTSESFLKDLERDAVELAIDGLTSGHLTIKSIAVQLSFIGHSFGYLQPEDVPTGWHLGTDFTDFASVKKIGAQMLLDAIIEGKPIGKVAVEFVHLAAVYGRDCKKAMS